MSDTPNAYSKMSDEKLMKSERTAKIVTQLFGGGLIVLFLANLVLSFLKGFSNLNLVSIALLPPILVVNIHSLGRIREEIKRRGIGGKR